MGGTHDISNFSTPAEEINRGIVASFPDPSNPNELPEAPIALFAPTPTGQIVLSIPGQAKPVLSCQVLFHIPNSASYINLASAKQLTTNIMSSHSVCCGELPSMGEIPITTTILAKPRDEYPAGFDYTMYIKRESKFNGIPYCYATYGPNHQKAYMGLLHTGELVQAGQLAALGRALARDHYDYLEAVIQDKCFQHPDLAIIKGV